MNIIAVTLALQAIGVKRWKSPVLTFGEKSVRRRAAAGIQGKDLALAPYVITVAINAERKVEIERRPACLGFFSQRAHLFVSLPLNEEMILLDALVIVAGFQGTVATGCRPMLPGPALALDLGAKGSVILGDRMGGDEVLKTLSALRGSPHQIAEQFFKDGALERHGSSVVN